MGISDKMRKAMDECPLCNGLMHYHDCSGQFNMCPQCDVINSARRIIEVREKYGKKTKPNDNNSCI